MSEGMQLFIATVLSLFVVGFVLQTLVIAVRLALGILLEFYDALQRRLRRYD